MGKYREERARVVTIGMTNDDLRHIKQDAYNQAKITIQKIAERTVKNLYTKNKNSYKKFNVQEAIEEAKKVAFSVVKEQYEKESGINQEQLERLISSITEGMIRHYMKAIDRKAYQAECETARKRDDEER